MLKFSYEFVGVFFVDGYKNFFVDGYKKIDYRDIPKFTDEQLKKFKRVNTKRKAAN